jgi:choline kinase
MMHQYAYVSPKRRVLILDVNDEFTDVKAIRIQDVGVFSVHPMIEIRRIRPFLDNGKKMTLDDIANTLFLILENYRNGLLLIEDINKYISDTMPNDLVGAICTNRHIGVDIIIHYQSIGRITSKVWQNLNVIRMHKITDAVKRHKHKFEDKFEYLSIAEILINQEYEKGNKRFFLYVNVDDEKVYGAFTKQQFENAVTIFIQNNYSNIINPMLNARDERGNKLHTAQSAIAEYKKRLMNYMK